MKRSLFMNENGSRAMSDTLKDALYINALESKDGTVVMPEKAGILHVLRAHVDTVITQGDEVPQEWLHLRLNPGIYGLQDTVDRVAKELEAMIGPDGKPVYKIIRGNVASANGSKVLSFEAYRAAMQAASAPAATAAARQ